MITSINPIYCIECGDNIGEISITDKGVVETEWYDNYGGEVYETAEVLCRNCMEDTQGQLILAV